MKKQKIILFVHTNTWFTEMFRVAKMLLQSEKYQPFVCFCMDYPTVLADTEKLTATNINWVRYSEFNIGPRGRPLNLAFRIFHFVSRVVLWKRLGFLRNYISPVIVCFKNLLQSLTEIQNFQEIILEQAGDLSILAGDLVGYNCSEIIVAGQELGVKTLVIPSTMSDGTEQAEAYFFNPQFDGSRFLNKLAVSIWPKWRKQHKNKTLVRLPAEQIFPKEFLGLAPPLPWIANSTLGDAIAVESQAMYDYYSRCGIDQKYLNLTGSIANDYLFQTKVNKSKLRSELEIKLGLDPSKKMVLTPLPPDFLYMEGGRPECEFKDYRSLTDFWVDSLSAMNNFNTVISLHPSVDPKEFKFLERDNVKISTLSIVDLIPLADLFVASVSSTIRWAVASSVPVVNYDVYKYRYADFMQVKAVKYVDDSKIFKKLLLDLNTTTDLKTLIPTTEAESRHWGVLDNNEGTRILNLIQKLIK